MTPLNSRRLFTPFLVVFSSLFYASECDIRLVCPRPQSPNASLTTSPCGSGAGIAFESDYMDAWPGLMTIKLEEPVIIKGTPLKISLLDTTKPGESCVLLDHIPHNNEVRKIGDCNNNYPLGGCTTPTYLTVRIPDIKCDKCVLQVVQIVAKEGKVCKQTGDKFNCTTFYSCSNIRIRPSSAGLTQSMSACKNYATKLANYPFAEVSIYWKELGEPFLGGFIYFFDSNGLINYNISYPKTAPYVSGVGLYDVKIDGIPFYVHFKRDGYFGYAGLLSSYARTRFRQKIKMNSIWIRLTYIDKKYLVGTYEIALKERVNVRHVYKRAGLPYDSTGMLAHQKISGDLAVFTEIAYPAGKCAPHTTTHGAVLYTVRDKKPRGIAIFKWTTQKMHLVSILGKKTAATWSVEFRRPEAIGSRRGIIKIAKRQIKDNVIATSVPVWSFILRASGPPTKITAKDPDLNLEGKFGLSLKAEIRDVNGKLRGLAMIMPTHKNRLRMVVMIDTYMSRTPAPSRLTLNGPASTSTNGPVIYDLTPHIKKSGYEDGVWISDTWYPFKDSELPLNMWTGDLYINSVGVQTRFNFRGQFEPVFKEMCTASSHVLCQTCVFSRKNDKTKKDLVYETEPTTGRATFHFNKKKGTLDISIIIEGVKVTEKVTKAYVKSVEMKDVDIATRHFKEVTYRSRTYKAQVVIARGGVIDGRLMAGMLELLLETTRTENSKKVKEYLLCKIPPFRKPPTFPPPTTSTTTTTTTRRPTTTTKRPTTRSTLKPNTTTTTKPTKASTKPTKRPTTPTTTKRPTTSTTTKRPTTSTTTKRPTTSTTKRPTTSTTKRQSTETSTSKRPTTKFTTKQTTQTVKTSTKVPSTTTRPPYPGGVKETTTSSACEAVGRPEVLVLSLVICFIKIFIQ